MAGCTNALKEWTGKTSAKVIYDSTVDEFTRDGLFNKVRGKPNVAVIATTTDGDVFGGFYSVAVTMQDWYFYDPNIFAFSFESHGRCETPQRFVLKDERKAKANVKFSKNDPNGFVSFGVDCVGFFFLGNERLDTCCHDLSDAFERLEDTTLTGKTSWKKPHHCTRLVAVQLE